MFTCGGRLAAQSISSAMSCAVTNYGKDASKQRSLCMEKEELTWLEALVYFIGFRLVPAEAHD